MRMKDCFKTLFLFVVLGSMIGVPLTASAFDEIKCGCGDECTLNIYGFLRNTTAMFMDTLPRAENGNQLASERTMLRLNVDWKMSNVWRFWMVTQLAYEPFYRNEIGSTSKKGGAEYSEYDNINDVLREVYIEYKPNERNQIRLGRQIVIWGEAMTSRITDVVQPDDGRGGFIFANLEDSRIPQYMIRGIHDLPFFKTSLEWLIMPNIVQYDYRVARGSDYEGGMGPFHQIAEYDQRFASDTEQRMIPPYSYYNPMVDMIVTNPVSSGYFSLPGMPYGWGTKLEIPDIVTEYPENSLSDLRYGFRTTSMIGDTSFSFIYFHTQNYYGLMRREGIIPAATPFPPTRRYTVYYPDEDIIGFSMNRQLSSLPGVMRAEVAYRPNAHYSRFNTEPDENNVVTRDTFNYMIAWDITGKFYFDWHKTATFDVSLEHTGTWIPNARELQFITFSTKLPSWQGAFNVRLSTSWFYNRINTSMITGYMTFGNAWLLMPTIEYTPGWLRKDNLKFTLQYVGISGNHYEGLGTMRDRDLIQLTTQFSF